MKAKQRWIWSLALIGVLALTACDDVVYTGGELEAKRKYENIKIGQTREAVVKVLGNPLYELVFDKTTRRYHYLDAYGSPVLLTHEESADPKAHPAFRFLPRKLSPKMLIYSAGTVFGYIGLSEEDMVVSVDVEVS